MSRTEPPVAHRLCPAARWERGCEPSHSSCYLRTAAVHVLLAPHTDFPPSVLLHSFFSTFLPNFCFFRYFLPPSPPQLCANGVGGFRVLPKRSEPLQSVHTSSTISFLGRAISHKLQLQLSFQRNRASSLGSKLSPHAAAFLPLPVQGTNPHNRAHQTAAWH